MTKKKQKQSFTNPDLKRQTKVPAPPCEEIEQQLWKLLQPEDFTPMHLMQGKNEKKLRARVLTLLVMMHRAGSIHSCLLPPALCLSR